MFNSTNLNFCPAQPNPQYPAYIPPPQMHYLPNQPRSTGNSKDIVKLAHRIIKQKPTPYLNDDHEKKGIEQIDPAVYWQRVEDRISAKKFTEILEEMLDLIRLEPKNSRAYLIAGKCYQELGQQRHAYSYLNQGITLLPDWPEEVYFRRAWAAMDIGKLKQAEADLETLLKQRTNSALSIEDGAYHMLLGKVKFFLKKPDQAFSHFDKVLMLSKELVADRIVEILSFKAIHLARQNKWPEAQKILDQMSQISSPITHQAVLVTLGLMNFESDPPDLKVALEAFMHANQLGVDSDRRIIHWFFLNNNPEPAEFYFRDVAQHSTLSADRLKANIFYLIKQAPTENLKNFYFAILQALPTLPESSMGYIFESVNCLIEQDHGLIQSIQKFREGVLRDSKNTPPKVVNAIAGLFNLLEFAVKEPMKLASDFEERADALDANLFPYYSRDEAQNAIIGTCYLFSRNSTKSLQFFKACQKNVHFAWFARFASHLVNNDMAKSEENFLATETSVYFAELLSLEKSYHRDTLISLLYISGVSSLIQNSQPDASHVVSTFLLDLMLKQFGLIRNTPIETPLNGGGRSSYIAVGVVLLTAVVGSLCMCKSRKKRVPLQPKPKVADSGPPPPDDQVVTKHIEDSLVELFDKTSSVGLKVKKVYKWEGAFEAVIECENANSQNAKLWEVLREPDYLEKYRQAVSQLLGPMEARISEQDNVSGWTFKFKRSPTPKHHEVRLKTQVENIKQLDANVHASVQYKIDCLHVRDVLKKLFDETSSVGLAVVGVSKSNGIFTAKIECKYIKLWPKFRLEKTLDGYKIAIEKIFDQVSYDFFYNDEGRQFFLRFSKAKKDLTEDLIKTAKEEIKKQDAEVKKT